MNEPADKLKIDQAVQAVAILQQCMEKISFQYLHLGEMLHFVKKNQLYKYYSEHTTTMSAFLREIDIGIGMSQADHLIRIFLTFGAHMEGRKIAFKRLLLVHPLVKGPETIEPLLQLAQNLPLKALSDEVRERQGLVPSDKCLHPEEALEQYKRCSLCGVWLKEGR